MTTREEIVAAARSTLGTPYLHQGRVPGKAGGMDCVGLPVWVACELGLKPQGFDMPGYQRNPDGHSLMRNIRREMAAELTIEETRPGDVIVVSFDRYPHHVGIAGDYRSGGLSLIHADGRVGKVVEHRLLLSERMRFVAAFSFPGVV
ncbi:MAG: NlpC/P60 family protein [Hydrogenophaga sp.]|uniref:NlpC/P60 family protein n=1 Tax=Hydrogenophaga sp. TaxID=1904254 RepID=UPI00273298DA|nr:NlpC/P60 family protein [Hydrogenophaga sp.]MDP3625012.1 NlpC/P60 family protein [Hydrogenophaga sp.]